MKPPEVGDIWFHTLGRTYFLITARHPNASNLFTCMALEDKLISETTTGIIKKYCEFVA